jgi:hypothetical protein
LNTFQEKLIEFDPTYKYHKTTDEFALGKKGCCGKKKKDPRPAWCDRILLQRAGNYKHDLLEDPFNNDDVAASKPVSYFRKEINFSDHRPVFAVFNPSIISIDKNKKELLKE